MILRRYRHVCLLVFLALACRVLSQDSVSLKAEFVRGKVFWKSESGAPFALERGLIELSQGLTLFTFFNGQCFLNLDGKTEVRMKEDSQLIFKGADQIEVRKGVVGVKASAANLKLNTSHVEMLLENGIAVIKTSSALTRICVVKGSIVLKNPRQRQQITISAGNEVAAGSGMFSKLYTFNDDLRFTWYWVEPAKEPGLMLE